MQEEPILCKCGEEMEWHETGSAFMSNIGYFKCPKCGEIKEGSQVWGSEPEPYEKI